MYRSIAFTILLFVSLSGFAQQNSNMKVIGKIPDASDDRLYQIQMGSFINIQNAEKVFERLTSAKLNPSYEKYLDYTRVTIKGINAWEIPLYIENVRRAGFSEVYIRLDHDVTVSQPPDKTTSIPSTPPDNTASIPSTLPVSTALIPSATLKEIAYRSVKVGETKSLSDTVKGKEVLSWRSSTPSVVSVDSNGTITGLQIGNWYISFNHSEYISVVVIPAENFYMVKESEVAMLPENSKVNNYATRDLHEYRTEPTFRLAYRFNNKSERKGASGVNGGIDILGRGPDYEWLWTTYKQGGWFYDLNGTKHEMVNGYQKDSYSGVELTVKPEFVYDKEVVYLQLRHILHNPNSFTVTGQKFGASADVMIHRNDYASLVHTNYGAYMTDSETKPLLELMFVCEMGNDINPVDTLFLGRYNSGRHVENVYTDNRSDLHNADSAIGFSYQNIDLAPDETKEFVVRFTLAMKED
jgi:hypothetical protein